MDRININKNLVLNVFTEYKTYLKGSNFSSVDYQIITDEKNHHYQLVAVGWEGDERIFYVIFQADLIGEKIWIQEDNTEDGLASFLEEKGISKKEIVLAYFPEYHRKYTAYAVA